jgi:hypothetical protein
MMYGWTGMVFEDAILPLTRLMSIPLVHVSRKIITNEPYYGLTPNRLITGYSAPAYSTRRLRGIFS